MKKLLLVAMATTCLWTTSHAQVGINTTEPNAILDVESDDSGILIPRVALTAANVAAPITTPTISELIYNTETAGSGVNAVTPGYYYWNGTVWVRLNAGTDATTNWSLTGNAGTNPANNFVGTTDAQALQLRTNDTERMRINANGNVGINQTSPTERLHVNGNFRLQGAFMPNNQAGNTDQILLSDGAGNSPVWGPRFLNTTQIQKIGKFYTGTFDVPSGFHVTLTVTDTNMTADTSLMYNFVGPLPAGPQWGNNVRLLAESRNGSVIFYITNLSIHSLTDLEIVYTAFYN